MEWIEWISQFRAIMADLPGYLAIWTAQLGPWIYVAMFSVIFAETGLVVTPFLPGDSLLFALGALTTVESGTSGAILRYDLICLILIAASFCGDQTNYFVGRWLGTKLFKDKSARILNPKHLERTNEFYKRHGGRTVIIARFLPIIRTYAPFVAGLGRMNYRHFATYSSIGSIIWISLFVSAGHFFGNIPAVKSRFQYVILAIIVISALPAVIEFLRHRRQSELAVAVSVPSREQEFKS